MRELFDWQFRTFVTPMLVRWLYVVYIVLSAVLTILVDLVTLANLHKYDALPWQRRSDEGWEFGFVFLSPLLYFIGVVIARVLLEVAVVLFNIAESLRPPPRP
jgi:hypothetical protein